MNYLPFPNSLSFYAADLGQLLVAVARIGGGELAVGGARGGLPAAAHREEGKSNARSEGRGWQRLLPHQGGRGKAGAASVGEGCL
jgi:hypothetical protein